MMLFVSSVCSGRVSSNSYWLCASCHWTLHYICRQVYLDLLSRQKSAC